MDRRGSNGKSTKEVRKKAERKMEMRRVGTTGKLKKKVGGRLRDRETERERDRETERQRDKETERQTDGEAERQRVVSKGRSVTSSSVFVRCIVGKRKCRK